MNYLPDKRQSQSPQSIPCLSHTPNPCRHCCVSSASVSMHTSRAAASKCIHLFRAPRRNHSVLLSSFSPAVQMEFCVNNISLVRQKISTGYHSRGDQITPSPSSPSKKRVERQVSPSYTLFFPVSPSFFFSFPSTLKLIRQVVGQNSESAIKLPLTSTLHNHAVQMQLKSTA